MFHIDKRAIKRKVNALGKLRKVSRGLDLPIIADSYKNTVWNMIDTLHEKDAYTMMNWIFHVDRWINNIDQESRTKYNRGDLVFVEWGAMNFGYEPSYEHPGVVIANAYNTVLVAPCSSQTYGRSINGIIDLPRTDATGLREDSGVAANAVRWISKNRIMDRHGIVTNVKILDKIEEYILKQITFFHVTESYYVNEIFDLKEQLEEEKKRIIEMRTEARLLIKDIEDLLNDKAPGIVEVYKEVAGSRQKSLDL